MMSTICSGSHRTTTILYTHLLPSMSMYSYVHILYANTLLYMIYIIIYYTSIKIIMIFDISSSLANTTPIR